MLICHTFHSAAGGILTVTHILAGVVITISIIVYQTTIITSHNDCVL